ncbi:ThuA domain-containing protein [Luteolibacter sp. GHJ8]|jgi:type 1 glutamine amidotransferase|uniref:ThuA domain-containing protein n=1 Tax=Luteolibacter rhizosphaerae TaxID=2989719 RepID=A0ABT3G0J3_9BACT|nr:ThuA domain-containing protein [Luteolibacter rhizosphaerae]MCW1913350.1 ThuA domain-containing protein [Luteolibacter rhizosphaerae]
MKPAVLALALCGLVSSTGISAAQEVKPLKVMLITGGCCHDYKKQTEILKKGLEERINVTVDQIHVDDGSTKPALPIYGNPDYGAGYDLIIHDECAADVKDEATVKGVLKPHVEDGIPAVALHCAMHSYRVGDINKPAKEGSADALWFEFIGIQSSRHGAQKPIEISFKNHVVTKGMKDWTTINEELYNNVKVFKTADELAKGKQEGEKDAVVVWTNTFGKNKVKVFGTTLGHNNATVEDPRYLDLVAKGALWATDKLDTAGKPKPGYGRVKK